MNLTSLYLQCKAATNDSFLNRKAQFCSDGQTKFLNNFEWKTNLETFTFILIFIPPKVLVLVWLKLFCAETRETSSNLYQEQTLLVTKLNKECNLPKKENLVLPEYFYVWNVFMNITCTASWNRRCDWGDQPDYFCQLWSCKDTCPVWRIHQQMKAE